DPLASGPHFTPDLAQGVGRLAAFTVPKATRIKDLFKDRFQTIDQGLLANPVIDRGYAQRPGLAGSSSFRDLQSSHSLRLIGLLTKLSMKPVQILIETRLKVLDRNPIRSARSLIGANALPRKFQVLACVNLVHQRVDLLLLTFEHQMVG